MADIDELADAMEAMALDRMSAKPPESKSAPIAYAALTPEEADMFQNTMEAAKRLLSTDLPPEPDESLGPGRANPVASIRRLLSRDRDPPLREFVECGGVPVFLEIATWALHGLPPFDAEGGSALARLGCSALEIAHDALWSLNNIASGPTSATMAVVESGCVPLFVQGARSHEDARIATICAWALGNVSGDSVQLRDFAIAHDAVGAICGAIERHGFGPDGKPNLDLLRNCAWALSNTTRYKPHPGREIVEPVIIMARSLLTSVEDDEVASDALWCFAYSIEGPCEFEVATYVLTTGLLPGVIGAIASPNKILATAALRLVGGIAAGSDENTEQLLRAGALEAVSRALHAGLGRLEKDAMWFLSNVAAGTREQTARLLTAIDDSTPPPLAIAITRLLAGYDTPSHVAAEAVWVVSNAIMTSDEEMVSMIIRQYDGLQALLKFLRLFAPSGERYIVAALDGLERLLNVEPELCIEYIATNGDADVFPP
eukprot:CAMPEP_0174833814 /NCGR_PEP_ID=MMETSP1114-20130205/4463_1 /TAXON_ID=312471 /ORGANISM="Neobodo designis, Strain CCAP 1951/1" /LENGTH=487 /DNA_ID=CAMNT_0016067709 /DNA_START=113 /DNA_END=1572 /DNA_ORIENTATION=+